jgi:hypothetical protein
MQVGIVSAVDYWFGSTSCTTVPGDVYLRTVRRMTSRIRMALRLVASRPARPYGTDGPPDRSLFSRNLKNLARKRCPEASDGATLL